MSRVLVTGGTGFIGALAVEHLRAAGHDVHAVSSRHVPDQAAVRWHRANLLDPDAAHEVVRMVKPELLLHLAWYVEHGKYWDSPENLRWVEATLRLLRAFAAGGGRRATLAGTCAEYDWEAGGVCREAATPLRPATLYGAAKHATQVVGSAFAAGSGFALAWGRIFFLYGPGEPATRLVPSVARALLEGEEVAATAGTQVRDFMHVDDVARAFVALLDSDVEGPVNIASGEAVELREVMGLIGATAGHPELVRLGALPQRRGEPSTLVADVRRLRDDVGFAPNLELPEGLRQTVEWWRSRSASGPEPS